MTHQLRGVTWDHPRGYRALDRMVLRASDGKVPGGLAVTWDRQPLADFEAKPLRSLANDYDVAVIDHPAIGEAVADKCLLPLDDVLPAAELTRYCGSTVGHSSESYCFRGQHWAVPIDVAAQVSVVRPDLATDRPSHWQVVPRLASKVPTALCLGGPHASLMLSAVCLALGHEPATKPDIFVERAAGTEALEIMQAVLAVSVTGLSTLGPIELLELMASTGEIAYCPLIYGYLPYQQGGSPGHRLEFFDAPCGWEGGPPGSVLGGAGLAVTRACSDVAAARALIERVYEDEVQRDMYPAEGAHSVLKTVWGDEDLAPSARSFYSKTRKTVDNAWVRPRFDGYVAFQSKASQALRSSLLEGEAASRALDRVDELFRVALLASRTGR